MPAALLAMRRKVRAELLRVRFLDRPGLAAARDGLGRAADAGTIDQDALLPDRRARFGEGGIDLRARGHVCEAEDAAELLGQRGAALFIEIENADPDPMRGEQPGGRLAEAGRAAGDDGGNRRIELHAPS